MNYSLLILEIAVVVLGLGLLLADLWTPVAKSATWVTWPRSGWGHPGLEFHAGRRITNRVPGMYLMDGLALFFKRFFLLAAIIVLVMSVEFADRIEAGISEFYALILFALTGMMFAASANDFTLLFVSVELITVTFYVLTSFQRSKLLSLEAGAKYLLSVRFLPHSWFSASRWFSVHRQMNFGDIALWLRSLPVIRFFCWGCCCPRRARL